MNANPEQGGSEPKASRKVVQKPTHLKGKDVPIPHDMPELPDDVGIIARLIDANCRAYSEEYGYHLDSRCLSHYNEGIVRLAQAGLMDLQPVLEKDGTPKVKRTLKKDADTGEEYEEEEVVLYEDVTDAPAQAVRVRAQYVPYENMVSRPTSDPIWKLQAEEMNRLRRELKQAREAAREGVTPPGVGSAPVLAAPAMQAAPAPQRAAAPAPLVGAFAVDPDDPDVPAWMRTAPKTPAPDPATLPRNHPGATLEPQTDRPEQ